ncbi:MAG TPA: hypothetical protein VF796_11625 [Humisphaera sp.]
MSGELLMRQVPPLLTVIAAVVFGTLVLRRSQPAGVLMLAAAACGVAAIMANLYRSRLYANSSMTWQFQYYATSLLWTAKFVLMSVAAYVGRAPEVAPPAFGFPPVPPPGYASPYGQPPMPPRH